MRNPSTAAIALSAGLSIAAAMARFAEPLSVELGVAVIDGVVAATVLAQALVGVPGLTG